MSGNFVFVNVKKDEVVYTTSAVPVEMLTNDISFYELDERPPAHWGQYLRFLVAQDDDIEAMSDLKMKEMLAEAHSKMVKTPFKKSSLQGSLFGGKDDDDNSRDAREDEDHFQLASLANLIGTHPSDMRPDTILEQLSSLSACALTEEERADLQSTRSIVSQYGPDLGKLEDSVVIQVEENLLPVI